jgi:hemerythrin-like domain-containing protein
MTQFYTGRACRSGHRIAKGFNVESTGTIRELTEALLDDHRLIEGILDRVKRSLERLGSDAATPALLEHLLHFLKYFAEEYHHSQEEDEFFVVLRQEGLNQIADMLQQDHQNGLQQIEALEHQLPAVADGDPKAVAFLREEGSHYIALTREHLRQEDELLYLLAGEPSREGDQAHTDLIHSRPRLRLYCP